MRRQALPPSAKVETMDLRTTWICIGLIAIALAGCAEDPTPALDDGIEVGDDATNDLLGAIGGVVVDPTIRPIPGASVTLQTGRNTTTDQGGVFVIDQLEPGFYSLTVSAPGHATVQTTADVKANTVSKVRAVLPIDVSPQPYHSTIDFAWFDTVGVVLADFVIDLVDDAFLGGILPNQCDGCFFDFESDGPVETFVLEAVWEEQIADPSGDNAFYWNLAQAG